MILKDACQWSREGWIWAPQEKWEEFVRRKENCLHIEFPKKRKITSSLFDIQAHGICVIEDNASLRSWQGAVLWEYETEGVKYPVIQIRKSMPRLWRRAYTQKEMIEHELVHAVRFAYKEPFFEEVLAYQTSPKKWRRFLGPLFIYPWEATLLLCASLGAFFFSLIQDSFLGVGFLLALFGVFFFRLLFLQGIFALCKRKLEKTGCASNFTLAVMLRLSDAEIVRIALRSSKNNLTYFQSQDKQDTRLSVLVHLYFKKPEEKQVYF